MHNFYLDYRVDMFMPEVDIVGGFSMYSSPEQLQREGTIDLAVKYSTHPPALWVHSKVITNFQFNIVSCRETNLVTMFCTYKCIYLY